MHGKLVIGTSLDEKTVDAQIRELEAKLKVMVKTLETEAQVPIHLRMSEDERIKLEGDIERTRNKIISLEKSIQKVPDDKGEKLGKSFEKGSKSLKRFALSLFSLGSIYSLVSKASSAYLSQDTERAQKIQSIWIGLGSFMTGAIDAISNSLLTGLGYLNEFIKALTGIDYIARANEKSLQKQAEAHKKLKSLASFDEVNKSTKNDSSTANNKSNLIEIPELDQGIVEKLQNLAKWLEENWDLIKKVGIALGVTFGAAKVASVLSGIGKIMGTAAAGTGLAGLGTALLGIAAVWTVTLAIEGAIDVKRQLDDLNESVKGNTSQTEKLIENEKELSNTFWENYHNGKLNNDQIKAYGDYIDSTTDSLVAQIEQLEENKTWWGKYTGMTEEQAKQQQNHATQVGILADNMYILYQNSLVSQDEYEKFTQKFRDQIGVLEDLGVNVDDLKLKYQRLTGAPYEITAVMTLEDGVTKTLNEIITNVKNAAKGLGGSFIDWVGSLGKGGGGGGGRRFALGGIVTQPTRAILGEAGYNEYVLPDRADYLSTLAEKMATYGSIGGNQTTNVYLDGRFIQRQVSKTERNKNFAMNR